MTLPWYLWVAREEVVKIDQVKAIPHERLGAGMWIGSQFSKIPWMTGNWMTLIGVLLIIPTSVTFAFSSEYGDLYAFLGTALGALLYSSDLFDGMIARYQQSFLPSELSSEKEEQMNFVEKLSHRGTSRLGKVLDPIRDKTAFLILLTMFGHGFVVDGLYWGCVVLAVLLTLVRPLKRLLRRGNAAANNIGKVKVHVQWITLVALIWIPDWDVKFLICNFFLFVAFCLAAASFWKHLLAPRV